MLRERPKSREPGHLGDRNALAEIGASDPHKRVDDLWVAPMRILSPRKVQDLTGLSRTTIWRLESAGRFPAKVQLSPGRKGYLATEVEDWITARAEERPPS